MLSKSSGVLSVNVCAYCDASYSPYSKIYQMSDNYIVSARKYRPATFRSVVGQKALTATLKNAIDTNRVAQAYLFTGPRGVGKTSCARIFAKTINCLHPTPDGEACGVCDSCVAADKGNSFNIIELDAASNNSVDDIRALTEQVNVPPQVGRYRVFIIDEVHMLTSAAFNAFLKTLEEPPSYVVFILATTEKHKVIPTILSRCQTYDFKRITVADMVDHLRYVAQEEGIAADPAALNVIARKADGAMRDALSIFDQVAASSMGQISYESTLATLNVLDYDYYFRLVEAFRQGDVAQSLLLYKEVRDKGFDSLFFLNGLGGHLRDLMVAVDPRTVSLLEVAEDVMGKYTEQAKSLPLGWYYAAMRLVNDADINYRTSTNKQFLVELTLIRLCQLLSPPQAPFDRVDAKLPLANPESRPRQAAAQGGGGNSQQMQPQAPQISAGQPQAPQVGASQMQTIQPQMPQQPSYTQQMQMQAQVPAAAAGQPAQQGGMRVGGMASGTPAGVRSGVRRPGTVSLQSMHEAVSGQIASARERHSQPFTSTDLLCAWREYIAANPDKQLLTAAMREFEPTRIDDVTYGTMVNNPSQYNAFEMHMQDLLTYLRGKLKNDNITIKVDMSEQEIQRKLPPHELLAEIVGRNAVLADFLRDIKAEMR